MNQRLPPLSSLKAFHSASIRESFAEAARELCVSQSAISQQIRVLEESLGVKLFKRLGNKVQLTDAGESLSIQVNQAFTLLSEACLKTSLIATQKSLVINAEHAMASRWLRPRLAKFRQLNPDAKITLNLGWEPNHASEVDIVIHFEERFNTEKYELTRLLPIDCYPACSSSFYQNNADRLLNNIEQVPLVHDNSRTIWMQWFNKYLPNSNSWKHGYVYSDLSLALEAALDGEGLFLADDIICKQEIESGALVKVSSQSLVTAWYCIAVSKANKSNLFIDEFIEWMVENS
ncbi:LysR family transcriptional regulator [Psychromonas sp. KJ10-2]|uniref:LysR family transcriptional regulator n=1 Tax=Psychromonas sp. KJ10-2 TaxID=3391822 RepID=UPI0039B3D49E